MTNKNDALIVLTALEKEAAPLFKQINKLAITDGDTYNLKSAKVDALKQLGKQALAKEKSLTDPLQQVVRDIQALFKPFRTLVSEAEAIAKDEMVQFQIKMERARAKVAADLESGKIAKLSTAAKKIAETEIISPTSSVRKVWTLEIVDVDDIPREYLVPDEAKIREAFKAGKKITGCKWEQKTTIAI